eukprot:6593113-Pyramimonas_sp.AAC.1
MHPPPPPHVPPSPPPLPPPLPPLHPPLPPRPSQPRPQAPNPCPLGSSTASVLSARRPGFFLTWFFNNAAANADRISRSSALATYSSHFVICPHPPCMR